MSTSELLQELATDIGNAYSAIGTKGGTLPQHKNTNNLATAIGTIPTPTGITPTGSISISANGTYDVTTKASAVVSVQGTPVLFTNHGTMYHKIMTIPSANGDGFYQYAYRYATEMEELYIPLMCSVWTATAYVFQGCTALKKAELDVFGMIGAYFFSGCTALEIVKLGYKDSNTYSIGSNAFNGCTVLDTLVLTGNKVCTLGDVSAFTGTPFRDTSGTGGKIYAPRSLISQYEAETNWSALENCTFAAIEGSIYE